jgi:hypothetical protein
MPIVAFCMPFTPTNSATGRGNIAAVLKDKNENGGERLLLAVFVFLVVCALVRLLLR